MGCIKNGCATTWTFVGGIVSPLTIRIAFQAKGKKPAPGSSGKDLARVRIMY
jgi:hypothetical protein